MATMAGLEDMNALRNEETNGEGLPRARTNGEEGLSGTAALAAANDVRCWWSGIGFKSEQGEAIIENLSGYVKHGEILFLMGPSGAGKSSLLDAIARRVKRPVDGLVQLEGEKLSQRYTNATLWKKMKYVQQQDVLNEVLTCRQTLELSAKLYVSDKVEAERRVDFVLDALGLREQAALPVGGTFFRGLSGGQKKRLSVGVELVALPRLMLLDEPTSGLDSASAYHVMTALKRVADELQTSFIITIHQPSETIYAMSDRVLLLSGGQMVYFGRSSNAVKYFQNLGHEMPKRTSTSEWLLNLSDTSFRSSEEVLPLIDAWQNSECAKHLAVGFSEHTSDKRVRAAYEKEEGVDSLGFRNAGFLRQLEVLMVRQIASMLFNPAALGLRFAMYLALSIMIGTVWLRVDNTADNITNIINVLFFIAAFMVFMSISVLPAFLEEKRIFIKERANGAYSVAAYNLAHFIVDAPFLFLLALVCGSITFFLIGLDDDVNIFFLFVLNLFLSFLAAESLMLLIASIVPFFIVGIAVGAFVYGAFMIVEGFFYKLNQIGWWWRWLHYVGFHSYSFANFMWYQFDGRSYPCVAQNNDFPCPPGGAVSGQRVLEAYDFENTNAAVNFVILLAMAIGYRVLAGFWMFYFHTGKR